MNNKNNIILICLLILCVFVIGCINQEQKHIEDESIYIKDVYTYNNKTITIHTNHYNIYIGNISSIKYNACGNSKMDTIFFNDNIIVNAYRLENFPIKINGVNIVKMSNSNYIISDIKILNE